MKLYTVWSVCSVACLAALVVGIAGCDSANSSHVDAHSLTRPEIRVDAPFDGEYPIDIVCTTGMVADLARNVAGEHARVTQLMPAGVDPHLYKVTPRDVKLLDGADVVFYSGLHLEGKMSDALEQLAERRLTFPVAAYVDPSRVIRVGGDVYDPHVWFDVALWSQAVDAVGDVLVKFDPAHAADYERNAAEYKEVLLQLDAETREKLATIPKPQRVLVTAHDAFHYFGRAYDVEVKSIQGISTDSEAGVRKVNELVDFIVDRGIKAVFVETSVPDRNIRALVEGCAAQGHKVVVGGELFSDAMGPEGTPEGTYPGMIRHNVDTIVNALK